MLKPPRTWIALSVAAGLVLIGCGSDDSDNDTSRDTGGNDVIENRDSGTSDTQSSDDDAAISDGGTNGGESESIFIVPDTPSVADELNCGSGPGVIFRWRSDGTSTTKGTLSQGVEVKKIARPEPFNVFPFSHFDGKANPVQGYLGEKAISTQDMAGVTIQSWFRASDVGKTHTLFSNAGSDKGIAFLVVQGKLTFIFSTGLDQTTKATRHRVDSDAAVIAAGNWYYASVSLTTKGLNSNGERVWRVAFFINGRFVEEKLITTPAKERIANSPELPTVAAEPENGKPSISPFDGDIHAVEVHNYPLSDSFLGSPRIVEGGRYFGFPSYHDYLTVPESPGKPSDSPPFSTSSVGFAGRVERTDHDGRFSGLLKSRTRLGLPFLNERFVPSGVAVSENGREMWMGFYFSNEDSLNPKSRASFLARIHLPTSKVMAVYRLADTSDTPITTELGGLTLTDGLTGDGGNDQGDRSLYVTVGKRVYRYAIPEPSEVSSPDPDLPVTFQLSNLTALEGKIIRGNNSPITIYYDEQTGEQSLLTSSSQGNIASLDFYSLGPTGQLLNGNADLPTRSESLPKAIMNVTGIARIADEAGSACFLMTTSASAEPLRQNPSMAARWCMSKSAVAYRLRLSAGAQALSMGPDGTLWSLHQSAAAKYQKRKSAPQWYDVLTPYVLGYSADAYEPSVDNCYTDDFKPYLGDLHTHSSNSDGCGSVKHLIDLAKNDLKFDFLFITDHANKNGLNPPPDSTTSPKFEACKKTAKNNTTSSFFASCGYEVGHSPPAGETTDGHANFLFPDVYRQGPMSLDQMYQYWSECDGCVGQINHPSSANYPWKGLIADARAVTNVATIELSNTVSFPNKGFNTYLKLLVGGWHASPVLNSDTHNAYKTMKKENGKCINTGLPLVDDGKRSGVMAASLNEKDLYEAIMARRTFASKMGHGSHIALRGEGCWMGARLQGYFEANFTVNAVRGDTNKGIKTINLYTARTEDAAVTVKCGNAPTCTQTIKLQLDPQSDRFVIAVAMGNDKTWMLSAPVWIED